jgi:hypothetical protein
MKPVQTCEILVNQNYPAFVYDNEKTMQPTSTKRMIINIRILHYDKNTKTKLLTLFGYERAMKVYWKYKLSDSDYKKCVLDPNIEEIYYNGMQAAKIITNLKLYETW